MFLAVWMIYAADRLLDTRQNSPVGSALEERHYFHRKHRRAFLVGIIAASFGLAALSSHLQHRELQLFSALGILLTTYCILVHTHPAGERKPQRVPKEFAVGVIFAAAVFIPTVARAPELRLVLTPVATLFAVVCALNCTLIYGWEHEQDPGEAHWTTRLVLRHLITAVCAILSLSACLCLRRCPLVRIPEVASVLAAVAVSFLLLHALRGYINKLDRRVLVDLVMLLPLPLLLLKHFKSP